MRAATEVVAVSPGTLDGARAARTRLTARTTTLDLSRTTFVKPGGATLLAAQIDAFCGTGRTLKVIAPRDYNTSNYLARIHFAHLLEDLDCTHTFPTVRENDLGHDLVPLTRVTSGADANALAAAALAFASPHDEDAAQTLCQAIGEAGENVACHSGARAGFVSAQRFPIDGRFEFAVADAGHGLLHTLRAVGATDHASAIDLALTEGVSGTMKKNRGLGLPSIRSSVANHLNGHLGLLSGDAVANIYGQRRHRGRIGGDYQGTLVHASFHGPRGRGRG